MKPDGAYTVLYSFGAVGTDGYSPTAPLIQGRDGAIYGLTTSGGLYGAGTVFKITLGGAYTVLYSFGAVPSDGAVPLGGLVQASDGNFYGSTASGGANHCFQIPQAGGNCGTIFRMSPQGIAAVIYSFGASTSDGVEPNGTLIQARDGYLYGTTQSGGANDCSMSGETHNCGTVFKVSLDGNMTILHSFSMAYSDGYTDGMAPLGALVQAVDGAFYGTTASGGKGAQACAWQYGCGTVFRMTADGKTSLLYSFATSSDLDGYGPSPYLTIGRDGNFYGTTNSGGENHGSQNGTAFRLTPSGTLTVLHFFGPAHTMPSNPEGGLVQGADGAFYGVTFYNGQLGSVGARMGFGTVFKMVLN